MFYIFQHQNFISNGIAFFFTVGVNVRAYTKNGNKSVILSYFKILVLKCSLMTAICLTTGKTLQFLCKSDKMSNTKMCILQKGTGINTNHNIIYQIYRVVLYFPTMH